MLERDAALAARSRCAAGTPESGTGITTSASTGMLAGEPAAERLARAIDAAAVDHASRDARSRRTRRRTCAGGSARSSGCERAQAARRRRRPSRPARPRARTRPRSGRTRRSRRRRRSASLSRPEHERAEAAADRARRSARVLGEEEERVGAAHLRERVDDAAPRRRARVPAREQVDDHLGVAGATGRSSRRASSSARSSSALIRLPLWPTASEPRGVVDGERLRVRRCEPPGGRVADVADGEVAGQLRERVLVERVRDQAHGLVRRAAARRRMVTMPADSWPRCWSACSPR